MKFLFRIALAAFALMVNSASAQLPPSGFEVGQAFPDMVLPSLDNGRPVSLSKFQGKKVILHIFASW